MVRQADEMCNVACWLGWTCHQLSQLKHTQTCNVLQLSLQGPLFGFLIQCYLRAQSCGNSLHWAGRETVKTCTT